MYEHSSLFSEREVKRVHRLLIELIHQTSKSSLVSIVRETYLSETDAVILHDIDPCYITLTIPDHQIPIYLYPHSLTLSLFTPPQRLRHVYSNTKPSSSELDHEFLTSVLDNEWDVTEFITSPASNASPIESPIASPSLSPTSSTSSLSTNAPSLWTMSRNDSTATLVNVREEPSRPHTASHSLLRTVSSRLLPTATPKLNRSVSMVASSRKQSKPVWK